MRIKDIAAAAGVSTATVSRVLSGKPNVRPEVQERVMAVVKELNYSPNRAARNLRAKTSSTIGLMVADIQNPFFASVSRAIEDVAQANDYSVLLCNSDENPDKERRCLELMQSENVAGIILAPTGQLADHFPPELAESSPMVIIDRRVTGAAVDSVLIDNVDAARTLTTHLLEHGYRRIAGLFGTNSVTGRERKAGFFAAHERAGIVVDPQLVLEVPAREEEGYQAILRLLEHSPLPEALCTSSSLLARGAYQALRDNGIAIPTTMAFATIDESSWTTMTTPPVTIVEQPIYAIGQAAAELLIKRINDATRPSRQLVLATQLIVRQSCGSHTT